MAIDLVDVVQGEEREPLREVGFVRRMPGLFAAEVDGDAIAVCGDGERLAFHPGRPRPSHWARWETAAPSEIAAIAPRQNRNRHSIAFASPEISA